VRRNVGEYGARCQMFSTRGGQWEQCTEDTGKLYTVEAGSSSQGDVVVRTAGYVLSPC
jgi:hypothetical protein